MSKHPYGVLIIHGFTASLDCVRDVEPPLRALDVPTRMPVLRGHGAESPEALRGVRWPDWVADAEVALKELLDEAERVILFGHSMGGLVALTLAAEYGPKIDSLVVAAPAIQMTSPFAPGKPLRFLAPLFVRLFKKWDLPPLYADMELVKDDTNYMWAPTDTIASFLEFGEKTRQRLTDIQVPTLIMQSHKDTVVAPESANIVYEGIATPAGQKEITWFEVTEHEMFRDCEREAAVQTVVDYVNSRVSEASKIG